MLQVRENLKKKSIESLGRKKLVAPVCVCLCVCVCVRERERERERERDNVCAYGVSCIKHFTKLRHSWCPDSESCGL